MSIERRILYTVLVNEFYRVYTWLFMLILFIGAGFMRIQDHVALAEAIIQNPSLNIIPVIVWIAYALLVMQFNTRELSFEKHNFLSLYTFLPGSIKRNVLAVVAASQLFPATIYGLFLSSQAIPQDKPYTVLLLVATLAVLHLLVIFRINHSLTHPERDKVASRPVKLLDRLYPKPLFQILVSGIVNTQPVVVLLTKTLGCIFLYGTLQLYKYDTYDDRLYLMATCVIFSANIGVVQLYHDFETRQFQVIRMLPYSISKRLFIFVVSMLIICSPELIVLLTELPPYLSYLTLAKALFYGLSSLLFWYGVLFGGSKVEEGFSNNIFFAIIGTLAMILFHVPVFLISVIQGVAGILLFKKWYYTFEPVEKKLPTSANDLLSVQNHPVDQV